MSELKVGIEPLPSDVQHALNAELLIRRVSGGEFSPYGIFQMQFNETYDRRTRSPFIGGKRTSQFTKNEFIWNLALLERDPSQYQILTLPDYTLGLETINRNIEDDLNIPYYLRDIPQVQDFISEEDKERLLTRINNYLNNVVDYDQKGRQKLFFAHTRFIDMSQTGICTVDRDGVLIADQKSMQGSKRFIVEPSNSGRKVYRVVFKDIDFSFHDGSEHTYRTGGVVIATNDESKRKILLAREIKP